MAVTRSMTVSTAPSGGAPPPSARRQRVYVDNAVNRRLQRVGKPYGFVAQVEEQPTPARSSRRLRGLVPEVIVQTPPTVPEQQPQEAPEVVEEPTQDPAQVPAQDPTQDPTQDAVQDQAAEEPRTQDPVMEDRENLLVGLEVLSDIDTLVDRAFDLDALNAVNDVDIAALLGDQTETLEEDETDDFGWELVGAVIFDPIFDETDVGVLCPDILFSLED